MGKLSDVFRGLAEGARFSESYGCRSHMQSGQWDHLAEQVEELEIAKELAEARLDALNRHGDGIHDDAVCFDRPMKNWFYPLFCTLVGRGYAEILADSYIIVDRCQAEGKSNAEKWAELNILRKAAVEEFVAKQEAGK